MTAIPSSARVNRRQFLVSSVLMGIFVVLPQAKGASRLGVEQLFRECAARAPDLVHWLEHAIPLAERSRLMDALVLRTTSPEFPPDSSRQRTALQEWIRDDFLAERTINAAGAELSVTEAGVLLIGKKLS
jgi:hypothetical protein